MVSDNALHLFTPKNYSFIRFNIESRPTSIYKDGSEFWVTSRDKGVYRLDQNKILHHYKFDPLKLFQYLHLNLNLLMVLDLQLTMMAKRGLQPKKVYVQLIKTQTL